MMEENTELDEMMKEFIEKSNKIYELNRLKELTVYDLLETTWSNGPKSDYVGKFEGNIVMTHQFQLELEPHINPLYVSEINMNTRFIRYALPLKRVRGTKKSINSCFNSNDQPSTLPEFYEELKTNGVQVSEIKNEILYNQEYFQYAKLKIFNQRMDAVIFEAERKIPQY